MAVAAVAVAYIIFQTPIRPEAAAPEETDRFPGVRAPRNYQALPTAIILEEVVVAATALLVAAVLI